MIKNLTPEEIKEILLYKKNARLIDVREEWENKIARIENSELMPLSNFSEFLPKISPEEMIILYCHHGTRSYTVASYLMRNGFKNVINMEGGIDAWSEVVDNKIPQY